MLSKGAALLVTGTTVPLASRVWNILNSWYSAAAGQTENHLQHVYIAQATP